MDDSTKDALMEYIKCLYNSEAEKKESLEYLYKFVNALPAVEPCKDAISREWLLNELEEMNVASFYELNEHSKGAYEDMKRMIKVAPSVTVEPKQGKWIMSDIQNKADNDNGNYQYICSECGHGDIHARTQEVPYCWWCGARMKGADDE